MKKIILYTLLLICNFSFSQDHTEKPNYKKIEKNSKIKNSNLFYESLMNRFTQADSTMTLEEKRHLYYGYTFDKNYSPYSRSDYEDSLRVVLQKEQLEISDFKKIEEHTNQILKKDPLDIKAISYQLFSLEQLNNKELFEKRLIQLKIILDAIVSSGKGITKDDPIYVINTSHEYELLNLLGFQFGGSQSLIKNCDYLTLAENDAHLKGLYFEVSPCLDHLAKMLK
ncbi:conserved exported hypothetical protein [Flavobacterium sp. 9AF]|uniref:DUF4919 domain-containing protein n=1 Tax=Flavobacterium sp. 9AF TaxID=2653142 RepID=UPI0012F3CC77|nr:DUF4919 domain-containing protein [Flavobacterium sp. 9AF]VXB67419.1 conserved exported hypothetical protein [Flavobacterium sp. 9AF]